MRKIFYKLFVLRLILILVFSSLPGSIALSADPVVIPGFDPEAVNLGAVRYRALKTDGTMGPAEVFLGVPDLGDGANRETQNLTWAAQNDVVFTYDEANDRLTTSISNINGDWTLVYPNFSTQVTAIVFGGDSAAAQSALSYLNYLQLDLTLGSPEPAQVDFMDVELDGFSLGDFLGIYSSTTPTLSWSVSGYDLSNGFTLTGAIVLTNLTGHSHELNMVEISFGYLDMLGPLAFDVTATPNPVVVAEPFTVTARVDDTFTGGSDVISAEYSLDNGANWLPMSAQDGAFDSPNEAVTASATAPLSPGNYDVCVRGTDSFSVIGDPACTTLVVIPADTQGPLAFNVAADPDLVDPSQTFTATAQIDDTYTGAATVISAEYTLDSGANWYPMDAQDGAFDSTNELVTAAAVAPASEGQYDLCVRGTDQYDNTGSQSCNQLVVRPPDTDGPIATNITALPNPVEVGDPFTVTALLDDTYTGGTSIASGEYTLDNGVNWLPMQAQDGTFDEVSEAVTASGTAPGTSGNYSLCVRGADALVNTGVESCAQLVVSPPDNAGPLTSQVNAAPNPVVEGESITVTAFVDDSLTGGLSIASAEYSLDNGTSWHPMNAQDGAFDEVSEATTASATAPTPEGNYNLCVRGKDSLDNSGPQSCTVLIVQPPDTSGPLASDVTATPNPLGVGEPFTIAALVDDGLTGGSTIASAEYSLDNGASWLPLSAQDGGFDEVSELVSASGSAPLVDGNYNLCVRGRDQHNNAGSQTCILLVVLPPDTQGPLSLDIAVTPNPVVVGEALTVSGLINDSYTGSSTIASAEYSLDNGGSWLPLNAVDGAFDEVSETVTASDFAPLVDGNYYLCMRGTDQHDNVGPQFCSQFVVLPPDSQGPLSVDIDAVPNPVVTGEALTISGLINDSYTGNSTIASAEYTLDHGVNWHAMSPVDGSFDEVDEQATASAFAPASSGNYDLCLRGTDSRANLGPQNCITLVVVLPDTLGPLVSGLLVSPNPVIVGEPLTLTALLDDTTTGNSLVSSAEYTPDGTNWFPMNPQDGSFDEVSEQVMVVLNAPGQAGQYTLCVRGSDEHGNLAFQACTNFTASLPPPHLLFFPLMMRQAGN